MKKNLFDPNPELVLSDYLYNVLLSEICRRLDLVDYLSWHLKLDITVVNETQARCSCLWCGGAATLLIDRENGSSECGSCFEKHDLFSLLCKGYDMPLVNTVYRLTGVLEGKDKQDRMGIPSLVNLPGTRQTGKGGQA